MTADSILGSEPAVRISASLAQASALLRSGDLLGAVGAYLDLLDADPQNVPALLGLARCEAALDRPEDALRWCEAVRRRAPNQTEAIQAAVLAAEQLQALGRGEEALDALAGVAGPWAAVRRGSILLDLGRFEEARAQALLVPVDEPALAVQRSFLLGQIALRTWRPREAVALFGRGFDESRPWVLKHIAAAQIMDLDLQGAYDSLAERSQLLNALGKAPKDSTARPLRFLLGNILHELMLEPDAAQSAREATDVESAAAAVRAHPDRLGPALGLLVRARQQDRLGAAAPATPGSTRIPRRIVQAWFGSPAPREVLEAADHWAALHPEWVCELFDERRAVDELGDRLGRTAADALRRARHPATAADFFRIGTLAASGGVWADADDRCLWPLDPLVTGRTLVGYQERYGFVANDLLAAEPGHPVLHSAVERAQEAILAGFGEATWLATGPGLMTRAVADWLAAGGLDDPAFLLLEQHRMRQYVAMGLPLAYKADERNWRRG